MNLLVKIALMSLGLYIVMPALADDYDFDYSRRGHWGWERKHRTRFHRHYPGEYEMERREYRPGKEEVTKRSIEEERALWGFGPRTGAVVEKEVKEVRKY